MWDLIVSVPDHCLSFYFKYINFAKTLSMLTSMMVRLSGVKRTILTFGYEVFMCAGVFFDAADYANVCSKLSVVEQSILRMTTPMMSHWP